MSQTENYYRHLLTDKSVSVMYNFIHTNDIAEQTKQYTQRFLFMNNQIAKQLVNGDELDQYLEMEAISFVAEINSLKESTCKWNAIFNTVSRLDEKVYENSQKDVPADFHDRTLSKFRDMLNEACVLNDTVKIRNLNKEYLRVFIAMETQKKSSYRLQNLLKSQCYIRKFGKYGSFYLEDKFIGFKVDMEDIPQYFFEPIDANMAK